MADDFTPEELHIISAMSKASQTLPEDFLSVPAVQELACLFVKIEPLLTDQQKATVIACGAMLGRCGKRAMVSEGLLHPLSPSPDTRHLRCAVSPSRSQTKDIRQRHSVALKLSGVCAIARGDAWRSRLIGAGQEIGGR